jgi:hypothetical protein
MGEVVSLARNSNRIEKLITEIHKQFAANDDGSKKADRARLRAGKLLIELRGRIEAGEGGEGVNWWKWYGENIARSKRDAMRVMKLASADDPEMAHEDEKEERRRRRHQRLVANALSLVEEMNPEQRQQFFAELERLYDKDFNQNHRAA